MTFDHQGASVNVLNRKTSLSKRLSERARKVIPGTTSYHIRFFTPYPFYVDHAKGSRVYDVDGNSYVDFWCTHFSLILGHRHPTVVEALYRQIERGYHYGLCHELEVALAETVVKLVPSADYIKFTNSGTEANMYAIRLARTYTKKNSIVKFWGGWHGGYDALHVGVHRKAGEPESGGLTRGALEDTIVAPFNDLESTTKLLRGRNVAAVIVEPVQGAAGMIPAQQDFLKGLRELCDQTGALLIFDEVITGFRLTLGGAQQVYGIEPDLTVLGKILGGGLPIGAIVGRGGVMEHTNFTAYTEQDYSFVGGTGVANPLSLAAGHATLAVLQQSDPYARLDAEGSWLRSELRQIFSRRDFDATVTGLGSLFCIHLPAGVAERFNAHLLKQGVLLLTQRSNHGAVSTAHSREDLEHLVSAAGSFRKS